MRPTDIPDSGLICDLLWSDPDSNIRGWGVNDRGASFTFGEDIVARFLQKHGLELICRAHQVVEDGYEFFANRKLVTIFSAPNYCGEFDNAGAMMSVDENLLCSFQILKSAEGQSALPRSESSEKSIRRPVVIPPPITPRQQLYSSSNGYSSKTSSGRRTCVPWADGGGETYMNRHSTFK